MKAVIIIPARLESTRLPRKLLLNETGKPLIQHTWEQAKKTGLRVVIAANDSEIIDAVIGFGGEWILTSDEPMNGTERVAEALEFRPEITKDWDIIIGWQADEPEINPDDIKTLVHAYDGDIGTIGSPIGAEQADDPNRIKVVWDDTFRALYFSRSQIPHGSTLCHWQHVGIYVYARDVVLRIARLPEVDLEKTERLEQLRWLYHGETITVVPVSILPEGINTREDYDAFVERQKVMA